MEEGVDTPTATWRSWPSVNVCVGMLQNWRSRSRTAGLKWSPTQQFTHHVFSLHARADGLSSQLLSIVGRARSGSVFTTWRSDVNLCTEPTRSGGFSDLRSPNSWHCDVARCFRCWYRHVAWRPLFRTPWCSTISYWQRLLRSALCPWPCDARLLAGENIPVTSRIYTIILRAFRRTPNQEIQSMLSCCYAPQQSGGSPFALWSWLLQVRLCHLDTWLVSIRLHKKCRGPIGTPFVKLEVDDAHK